jgi:hypothetical protein
VNASLRLPTATPTDAATARACELPIPDLLHTELSDAHTVAGLALPATEETGLCAATAKPAPSSVTLMAPVAAPFEALTLLTAPPVCVNAADKLPLSKPTVIDSGQAARTPALGLHCTELADVHRVEATRLPPTRSQAVASDAAKLVPRSVTLALPVDAPLAISNSEAEGPSSENALDTVASQVSALTETH